MKKTVLALFAVTSMVAFAEGGTENHIYGKIGADVYSRYNKIQTTSGEYSTSGGAHGFSGMVEFTRDISQNMEVGAGIGFIHRSAGKHKTEGKKSWKTPKYDTVPLYVLAKYNFTSDNEWKPYIKADLGIAFNDSASTLELDWEEKVGIKKDKLDVKHGLYTGIGVGVEYQNFLAELSYHITTAKAKGSYYKRTASSGSSTEEGAYFHHDYNNHAITLALGYKFNF